MLSSQKCSLSCRAWARAACQTRLPQASQALQCSTVPFFRAQLSTTGSQQTWQTLSHQRTAVDSWLRHYPHQQHQRICCCSAHSQAGNEAQSWEVKMLYDGDCPLCMREVNMLKKRDKQQNKICFVDIAAQDYDPASNAGISYEQAMGTIHGILPGDQIITNVDVFRKLYETVGLGWVYSITKYGPINKLANRVYAVWAKYRLPLTGRPDIEVVLREKQDSCKPASQQS